MLLHLFLEIIENPMPPDSQRAQRALGIDGKVFRGYRISYRSGSSNNSRHNCLRSESFPLRNRSASLTLGFDLLPPFRVMIAGYSTIRRAQS